MKQYSGFGLVKHALSHHENWQRMWRNPAPKREYDVIIVGGGGHGLATAYYLAKVHGITNVAVVEKGWLGGGNTARNTTIVRSNYLWDESAWLFQNETGKANWAEYEKEIQGHGHLGREGGDDARPGHTGHPKSRRPGWLAANPHRRDRRSEIGQEVGPERLAARNPLTGGAEQEAEPFRAGREIEANQANRGNVARQANRHRGSGHEPLVTPL